MAVTKLLPVFLSTVLLVALGPGGFRVTAEQATPSDGADSSALQAELEQLKSNIHILEARLAESDEILTNKDAIVSDLEKVVQHKSNSISLLQSEIHSFQGKSTSEADELVDEAYARATELQKQFDQLNKVLETQSKENNELEARANEAEKKIKELNIKLKNVQKVNDEQQVKIQEVDRSLQVAQEETMKAKLEASSRTKELFEVHSSWLPPWLAESAVRFQAFIVTEWNEHGGPVMKILIQKGTEINTLLGKWARPHAETMKIKWAPFIRDKWLMTVEYLEPHLKLASGKIGEAHEIFKTTVKPHVIKVQDLADPYYQEVKKLSKPYVDQVATKAKPHVEKARVAFQPYTTKAVHSCMQFLETATTYHHQVQATVRAKMNNHEVTRHLATNELVWFAASALLALPVIVLSRLLSHVIVSVFTTYGDLLMVSRSYTWPIFCSTV